MGMQSGRVANWFASQLITGERPLTRNGRRLQQRVGWGFLLNLVGFPLKLYSAVSCVYPDVS